MQKIEITAVPLTRDAFNAFGDVVETEGAQHFETNAGYAERFHDLARIECSAEGGRPLLSIFRAKPFPLPLRVVLLERHPISSQAFIPMGQAPFLIVVADRSREPQPADLRAFIANGRQLAALRYCFDFGCYRTEDPARVHEANLSFLSLWYTLGHDYGMHDGEWKMTGGAEHADSILVASEPLTRDTASWVELPEYGALFAETRNGRPRVSVRLLD